MILYLQKQNLQIYKLTASNNALVLAFYKKSNFIVFALESAPIE